MMIKVGLQKLLKNMCLVRYMKGIKFNPLFHLRVFPRERTYRDTGLYLRIKTLDWINYHHLEIAKANRVDEMWDLAAEALLKMDNSRTAI